MTETHEQNVVKKCVELATTKLTSRKPLGWRALMCQVREHTVKGSKRWDFDIGSIHQSSRIRENRSRMTTTDISMMHHYSSSYFLPSMPGIEPIDRVIT